MVSLFFCVKISIVFYIISMQHTTIGSTTTFYSTTEESRINKSVSADNIRFLVKLTNDFSGTVKFVYAQNIIINNRYTSFEIFYNTNEDILTGNVNLNPEGYWTYEIYEISWIGSPSLTNSTAPLSEITILSIDDTHGVNNGLIENGKLLSSDAENGQEVQYSEYVSGDVDTYVYPFQDNTTSNVINGCTDGNAINYNANATTDDGSCTYNTYGCTDPAATNYSASATADNGSCTFDFLYGCMDSTASNYNPNATVDNGSCVYIIASFTSRVASEEGGYIGNDCLVGILTNLN